jgi:hypothetical protein
MFFLCSTFFFLLFGEISSASDIKSLSYVWNSCNNSTVIFPFLFCWYINMRKVWWQSFCCSQNTIYWLYCYVGSLLNNFFLVFRSIIFKFQWWTLEPTLTALNLQLLMSCVEMHKTTNDLTFCAKNSPYKLACFVFCGPT